MINIEVGDLVLSTVDFLGHLNDPIVPFIIDYEIPLLVIDIIKSSKNIDDDFYFLLYKDIVVLAKRTVLKKV